MERSFLCTHRKFISTIATVFCLARIVAGTAVMNPTSFLLLATRTPRCHSGLNPGGCSAHFRKEWEYLNLHQDEHECMWCAAGSRLSLMPGCTSYFRRIAAVHLQGMEDW